MECKFEIVNDEVIYKINGEVSKSWITYMDRLKKANPNFKMTKEEFEKGKKDNYKIVREFYKLFGSYVKDGKLKIDSKMDNEIDVKLKGKVVNNIQSFQLTNKQVNTTDNVKLETKSNFQGYVGGFDSSGKGTPQGDGKDKAMREIADGFVGEIVKTQSSSYTSALSIQAKTKKDNTEYGVASDLRNRANTYIVTPLAKNISGKIMLARNSEFNGKPLDTNTKLAITNAFNNGSTFIVGDMPNVDTQFIDYLQEIGAKFQIYHTGNTSRIQVSPATQLPDNQGVTNSDISNTSTNKINLPLFNPNSPEINIYAGSGENANLSNFAIRPFTFRLPVSNESIQFQSVEQAFQYAKLEYAEDNIGNQRIGKEILQTKDGAKLRQLGKSITGLNQKEWDNNSSMLMKMMLRQSFLSNPYALRDLLNTGDSELTHTQDKGKWGKEFPKLLMEVRSEFNPDSKKITSSKNVKFEEEQTTGYRNRTIKNASADATIAIALDFNTAGEKLTKNSVLEQGKKYISIDGNKLEVTKERVDKIVEQLNSINKSIVEEFKGFWTRQEVAKQTDKVFLFGDNTDDRLNTKYIPSSTQAVIRDLPNAIGIDTKKDRGTNKSSYFTDADFDVFKQQVDEAIQQAKNSGKTIVIPADGIGTGKAMLKEKAPKLFNYLQQELNKLKNDQSKGISLNIAGNGIYTMKGIYTQEEIDQFTYELLKAVIKSPNLKNKIISIRTGGQTGFDEAGTKAGIRLGLPTLTLAPKNWTFRNVNGQDISDEKLFKDRFKDIYADDSNPIIIEGNVAETLNDKLQQINENIEYNKNRYKETLTELNKYPPNRITLGNIEIDLLALGITFKLNEGQIQSLNEIVSFIENPSQSNQHTLTGSAGTGKSSITAIISQYLTQRNKAVAYAAPSHAAKNVLQTMIGSYAGPVETVAKLLGSTADISELDEKVFTPNPDALLNLKSYTDVIVIDEISMVNDGIVKIFEDLANTKREGRDNIKIIYIGDKEQLPPVGQTTISKVFLNKNVKVSELKIVERQNTGNPITNYLNSILKAVEKEGEKIDVALSTEFNEQIQEGIIVTNEEGFIEQMKEAFNTENYKNDFKFAKVLCYTNANVKKYNDLIRQSLNYKEHYNIGEILFMYDTITPYDTGFLGQNMKRNIFSDNAAAKLTNGNHYRILNKETTSQTYNADGGLSSLTINGFRITLQDLENPTEKRDIFVLDETRNNSDIYLQIVKFKQNILNRATKATGMERRRIFAKEFYPFVNTLVMNFNIDVNGNIVRTSEKKESQGFNKNIDYAYAMTVHKSQGSTFTNVFVDNVDINKAKNPFDYKKLLYVAHSRPSKTSVVNKPLANKSSIKVNYNKQQLNKNNKKELIQKINKLNSETKISLRTIEDQLKEALFLRFINDNLIGLEVEGDFGNSGRFEKSIVTDYLSGKGYGPFDPIMIELNNTHKVPLIYQYKESLGIDDFLNYLDKLNLKQLSLLNQQKDIDYSSLSDSNELDSRFETTDKDIYESMIKVIENLSNKLGVPYEIDETMNVGGRFKNGKVYFNPKKMTKETPFHEFSHPFIHAVKRFNPELYNNLVNEIYNTPYGQAMMKEVQELYSDKSKEIQEEEAIVELIARYSTGRISESDIVNNKSLWDKLVEFLRSISELIIGQSVISISNLNSNLTLKDLSNLLVNDGFLIKLSNNQKLKQQSLDYLTSYLETLTNAYSEDNSNIQLVEEINKTKNEINNLNGLTSINKFKASDLNGVYHNFGFLMNVEGIELNPNLTLQKLINGLKDNLNIELSCYNGMSQLQPRGGQVKFVFKPNTPIKETFNEDALTINKNGERINQRGVNLELPVYTIAYQESIVKINKSTIDSLIILDDYNDWQTNYSNLSNELKQLADLTGANILNEQGEILYQPDTIVPFQDEIYDSRFKNQYGENIHKSNFNNFYTNEQYFKERPDHREWYVPYHLNVVQTIVDNLHKQHGGNKELLDLAVWTHDLMKAYNNESDNSKLDELLKEKGYDENIILQLKSVLNDMELYKKEGNANYQGSIEAQILSTADALSHYTSGTNGFLNIFKTITKPNSDVNQIKLDNMKKISKDKRKLKLGFENVLDNIKIDYTNNPITIDGDITNALNELLINQQLDSFKQQFNINEDEIYDSRFGNETESNTLDNTLLNILNDYNIIVDSYDLNQMKDKFGVNTLGVFDILNKTVSTLNEDLRNITSIPNVFSYAFFELMGTSFRNNKEYKELIDLVPYWENYQDIYNQYYSVYQSLSGKPSNTRIKKEAIAKALSEALINYYNNPPKAIDENQKGIINKIIKLIKNLIEKFKYVLDYDNNKFKSKINSLAEQILTGKHSSKLMNENNTEKLLTFEETIENQNKEDGGRALEFMQLISKNKGIIVGSLAIRKQGTVYRNELDSLHDIDVRLNTFNVFGQNINTNDITSEMFEQSELFKNLKDTYGENIHFFAEWTNLSDDYRALHYFLATPENAEKLMSSPERTLAKKYSSLDKETQKEIILIDFFVSNSKVKYIVDETYGLNLSHFTVPFYYKQFGMGREKDVFDYQNLKIYDTDNRVDIYKYKNYYYDVSNTIDNPSYTYQDDSLEPFKQQFNINEDDSIVTRLKEEYERMKQAYMSIDDLNTVFSDNLNSMIDYIKKCL